MDPGSFGSRVWGRGRLRRWAGAIAALLLLGAGALPALGQEDPPGRVGRLNYIQGAVSFSPAGSDEWVEARSSRPITSGDRIWMDRDSRSELSIGSAVLRSDEETSLKVLALDDDEAQFQLSDGTLAVQVRDLDRDDRLEIATPNLAFVVDRPGEYRIEVDPDRNTTFITVRRGHGTAYADDGQHRLDAPAYARFVGEGLDVVSGDLPAGDGFDRWVEARIDRDESRQAARYVPRDMVGYEDLDDHGYWRQEPDYGWVWMPRITIAAWAPYRYGHWAWIAPWGWTWVDDAPWGFAPFHYGRWAHVRNRWCWVPGPIVRRPYYAPALVAFVGSPGGWSVSSSGRPAVAWFPLAPREEYRPVYRVSNTYITRINQVVIVERERHRHRAPQPGHFANRLIPGAATALPARAFVEGRSVAREQIRVPEGELQRAAITGTMSTLAPVKASLVGQQAKRAEPPRRQERERPVVTTRMPKAPPIERDELAKRFAQGGGQVREAGPTLAEQPPRRAEGRDERTLRLVVPRREGGQQAEERRPPAGEQPQQPQQGERRGPLPQAVSPRPQEERERGAREQRVPGQEDTQRAAPDPRREREERLRGFGVDPESPRAPEAAEQARPRPERREADRPPEAQRPATDQRREREERLRGFGLDPRESGGGSEAGERPRAQPERREANRPPEAQRSAPEPRREREEGPRGSGQSQEATRPPEAQRQRPDRLEDFVRQRERAEQQRPEPRPMPEIRRAPEPGRAERQAPPEAPQFRQERANPRQERQEEHRSREAPQPVQQREVRAQPRVQEGNRPEQRQDAAREQREQQQRERAEQNLHRFGQEN